MAKTNRSRRKKAHPMSAGQRYACGKKKALPDTREERALVRAESERVDPTPQTLRQIKLNGPTCIIQRMAFCEVVTGAQAQALSAFAALRRKCGFAERNPMPVEGRQQPQAPGSEASPEEQLRAKRAYDAARDALTERQFIAVSAVCDQRHPRDFEALKDGAKVLERHFVRGEKAA